MAGDCPRAVPELAAPSPREYGYHARTAAHLGTSLIDLWLSAAAAPLPGNSVACRPGNPGSLFLPGTAGCGAAATASRSFCSFCLLGDAVRPRDRDVHVYHH